MKILRKRRGFSTNSSSSFEWVPPDATTTAGTGSPGPAQSTASPGTTGSQTAQTVTLPTSPPAAPLFSSNSPLFGIGLVGVLICGLFFVEEILRRLWKKFKVKKRED